MMNVNNILQQSNKIKPIIANIISNKRLGYSGRCASTSANEGREEAVVVSKDGQIVVCWHPEPTFPYECTRPIPQEAASTSALKFKYDSNMKDTFRKVHPFFENQKLREITFTNKHIWFPKKDRNLVKFKKKIPRDREYL